jgi:hypothetical protein
MWSGRVWIQYPVVLGVTAVNGGSLEWNRDEMTAGCAQTLADEPCTLVIWTD